MSDNLSSRPDQPDACSPREKDCDQHACGCGRAKSNSPDSAPGVSRRNFMKTLGVSVAATSLAGSAQARASSLLGRVSPDGAPMQGPEPVAISLNVNGRLVNLRVDPATTLLEVLRFHLNLTGTKEICDRGACGGCSVLIDGNVIDSCMMLAVDAVNTNIITIEGLNKDGKLDAVQEAFIRHDALQCGYCTPGFIIATRALLDRNPKPTLAQIRHGLSGNICRCGTYTNIFNAVLEASGQSPIMDQKGA
jgi:xanthine dehydrogenase YagT iron-sulfur-binding subunit